jgi:hypothetical protein
MLWPTVLLARGHVEEAAMQARMVWEQAQVRGDHAAASSIAIVLARALNNLRRHEECLEVLSALEPTADAMRAELDAVAVAALGELGRHDEMRARASEAAHMLGRLPIPNRVAVGQALARALYNAGQLRDAARLLDSVTIGFPPGMPPVHGRLLPFLRACIAIDSGNISRARAELDQLTPYVGALLRPYYANARATLALIDGDFVDVQRWLADRESSIAPWVRAERDALQLAVRELRRESAEGLPPASGGAHGVFGQLAQIRRAHVEVHTGDRTLQQVCEGLPGTAHPELSILADIVRADAALAAGDVGAATKLAVSARMRARESGYAAHTARALQVLCDAALVGDDKVDLMQSLDELESLANEMPSRRFAQVAAWYRATLAMDVARLEAIAGSPAAPDVALRASAQLGDDPQLGRADRVVLAACRRAARDPEVIDPSMAGDPWGIDEPRASVWFHDGAEVDLAKQPGLFKLLVSLARTGGRASKEQLVALVWGEQKYHPLMHDNRLQAAIRKLRLRIEADAGRPVRLITTEEGYALGGRVRLLKLRE